MVTQTKAGVAMKVLHCRDAGFDCDRVIRAETEEEVLKQAASHAKKDHHIEEIDDKMVENIKAIIKDE